MFYLYINKRMSEMCKKLGAKAGAKAGTKAGAKAGADVYAKDGSKAGVWMASRAGADAGALAGASAGAKACVKFGASASVGASAGAKAGASAGAKAGAKAYDDAVVADGHTIHNMWRRGWSNVEAAQANAKAAAAAAAAEANAETAKANAAAAAAADAAEASVCAAKIPPAFLMKESDFKPISRLYTEVYREGNGVEKIFELKSTNYYKSITIDMNDIFEQLIKDTLLQDNPNRIFVTINNGQSQQFFVRSDYWEQNSKYIGSYSSGNKYGRNFSLRCNTTTKDGRIREYKPSYIHADTCERHTYYRELPRSILIIDGEEYENCIDNCIDNTCNLSGGKSRKNRRKSRKNRRKSNRRRL